VENETSGEVFYAKATSHDLRSVGLEKAKLYRPVKYKLFSKESDAEARDPAAWDVETHVSFKVTEDIYAWTCSAVRKLGICTETNVKATHPDKLIDSHLYVRIYDAKLNVTTVRYSSLKSTFRRMGLPFAILSARNIRLTSLEEDRQMNNVRRCTLLKTTSSFDEQLFSLKNLDGDLKKNARVSPPVMHPLSDETHSCHICPEYIKKCVKSAQEFEGRLCLWYSVASITHDAVVFTSNIVYVHRAQTFDDKYGYFSVYHAYSMNDRKDIEIHLDADSFLLVHLDDSFNLRNCSWPFVINRQMLEHYDIALYLPRGRRMALSSSLQKDFDSYVNAKRALSPPLYHIPIVFIELDKTLRELMQASLERLANNFDYLEELVKKRQSKVEHVNVGKVVFYVREDTENLYPRRLFEDAYVRRISRMNVLFEGRNRRVENAYISSDSRKMKEIFLDNHVVEDSADLDAVVKDVVFSISLLPRDDSENVYSENLRHLFTVISCDAVNKRIYLSYIDGFGLNESYDGIISMKLAVEHLSMMKFCMK
jgi:hypothetical protein